MIRKYLFFFCFEIFKFYCERKWVISSRNIALMLSAFQDIKKAERKEQSEAEIDYPNIKQT